MASTSTTERAAGDQVAVRPFQVGFPLLDDGLRLEQVRGEAERLTELRDGYRRLTSTSSTSAPRTRAHCRRNSFRKR
jgi:hypothetical protein